MSSRQSMHTLSVAMLALALGSSPCGAGEADSVPAIQDTLRARFPDVPIVDVRPAPLPGLYEVFTGDSMAYTDANGDYLLNGSLLDTRSKRNLTAERIDERNRIEFRILPLNQAIKTVRGTGRRTLAVFSDPDCPYCQQLEKDLGSLADVTIYTFLYPLADLHPDAPKKARVIWCAANPSAAWSQWMLESRLPTQTTCEDAAIKDNLKLGQSLRIRSTPTLIMADGRRISGAIPAAQIEKMLDAAR